MVDPMKVKVLAKHLRKDCGAVLILENGVHRLVVFFEGELHEMFVHPDIVFALYQEQLVESHQGKWIRGRNWACGLGMVYYLCAEGVLKPSSPFRRFGQQRMLDNWATRIVPSTQPPFTLVHYFSLNVN